MPNIIEKRTLQIMWDLIPPSILLVVAFILFDMAERRTVQYLLFNEDNIMFSPIQIKLIPALISFLLIFIYNKTTKQTFSNMPFKMNFLCGITFFAFFDIFSIPQVQVDSLLLLIARSSNLLVIVFFGTFFPFFQNKYQTLTQKQILISCFLTIINLIQHSFFNITDQSGNTNFFGFAALIIYLIASALCFNLIQSAKEGFQPTSSELAQRMNMWLAILLTIFSLPHFKFFQLFVTFFTNFSFFGNIMQMSLGWIFIQIFAFKLIKDFRLHIFPLVLFAYKSIEFQIYDEKVTTKITVIYSLLICALLGLALFFQVGRTKKIKIVKNGGSEVGLQVRSSENYIQNYQMMRN